MKKELQDKLFEKYPEIFRQQTLPFGIETDDGWYDLIDMLCCLLQWDVDHNRHPQIEASQVKEKFGTLRFYVNGSDEKQQGVIAFAEHLSGYICEECGSNKDVKQTTGWIYTRCPDCMKKLAK